MVSYVSCARSGEVSVFWFLFARFVWRASAWGTQPDTVPVEYVHYSDSGI